MEFDEFWENTKKLLARDIELETISRTKFKAGFDSTGGVIVVTPNSTNLPRDVSKGDFKKVYQKMRELKRKYGDIYRPALYQRITRNSSYILPIIKAVHTEGGKQKTLEKQET
ncbi:MAG TPA: hypothetical protein ENH51_05435 [Euryarchaeota archaeon]|nr:hypothetical protein [Euryarchaeota archaeon]